MKLINDNLKKVGYFNAALIVIAIVLGILNLGGRPLQAILDSVLCIIALVFGLFYTLSGYKKDAAKYYKIFMYLYALSSLVTFISMLLLISDKYNFIVLLLSILDAVVCICSFVLAFKKDLGKEKSAYLSFIILCCAVTKTTASIIEHGLPGLYMYLMFLLEAIILVVLVSAKYADKASRGAK